MNLNVVEFAASNKTVRHCLKGWRADPIDFPVTQDELPLDPYWLGCWLGDGCQHMPALTSPECGMVDVWKRSAKQFGYEISVVKSREGDGLT